LVAFASGFQNWNCRQGMGFSVRCKEVRRKDPPSGFDSLSFSTGQHVGIKVHVQVGLLAQKVQPKNTQDFCGLFEVL